MRSRVISRPALKRAVGALRKSGKRIVFTNGCFDLLHIGHVRYLERAGSLGDVLVVGVNSDRSVRKLKGSGRPLMPEGERAEILAALSFVDYVTIFGEDTPAELIEKIKPDVLVKGSDYGKREIVGRDVVEEGGGRVVRVPLVRGCSTKRLIRKIVRSYGG
ncbi:MAG: D-glycero-beta-D-manno-heptose 1-phosphate adenylyltransferase [Candidatus Tritonobacter lacicola]|nr:D-glycero-beta-D-manno-heptose 1-phosphate adenylyltransferase [Candidatus Tritonobacter lacicola]